MPKCDFNKVATNFNEITLEHECSPVNHMAEWNLFDVVNSVSLKFPTDDL